ncbi:MAG: hypothetical protein ACRDNW_25970 [Trebonia sp.]
MDKKERDAAINRAIDGSGSIAEMMDRLKADGIVAENELGMLSMPADEAGR